jgi:hypothetical protein
MNLFNLLERHCAPATRAAIVAVGASLLISGCGDGGSGNPTATSRGRQRGAHRADAGARTVRGFGYGRAAIAATEFADRLRALRQGQRAMTGLDTSPTHFTSNRP